MKDNCLGGFIAFALGWFIAQGGKLIGDLIKKKRLLNFEEIVNCFVRSGGMPSGHTASFLSVSIFLGMKLGFTSGVFVLALCMTVIVVYDAVNVRYAVGEQGKLLNAITEKDLKVASRKKLKVVEGHTIPQAIVGAIIGILVGFLTGFYL